MGKRLAKGAWGLKSRGKAVELRGTCGCLMQPKRCGGVSVDVAYQ